MPRESLDRQLKRLIDEVILLGSMVEEALLDSARALKDHDAVLAMHVRANDQWINEKRLAIENQCLMVLATQQPVARDIRVLAAILEIITELERIGDYAKGVSRITTTLTRPPSPGILDHISTMARLAVSMLHRALSAFATSDLDTARSVPGDDDEVDRLYLRIYHRLIAEMTVDTTLVDDGNLTLWAAHNFERAADRVSNICERTVFIETGILPELDEDVNRVTSTDV